MENKMPAGGRTVSEAEKKSVIEKLWLTYYNNALYEEGVISEHERNKMKVLIEQRSRRHSGALER